VNDEHGALAACLCVLTEVASHEEAARLATVWPTNTANAANAAAAVAAANANANADVASLDNALGGVAPMTLVAVRSNLLSGAYTHAEMFAEDVRQVWRCARAVVANHRSANTTSDASDATDAAAAAAAAAGVAGGCDGAAGARATSTYGEEALRAAATLEREFEKMYNSLLPADNTVVADSRAASAHVAAVVGSNTFFFFLCFFFATFFGTIQCLTHFTN
jgi:hypothetical protein